MLHFHPTTRDLSTDLSDINEWSPADLRHFDSILDISALAFDPVSSLLAIGTSAGTIRILGRPGVDVTLVNGVGVKFLQFSCSNFKLVCVDQQNRLRVWALDKEPTGQPEASTSCKQQINAILTSPAHSHVLVALQSGEVRAYDLVSLAWSPPVAPNLWKAHEERLLASGFLTEARPNSQEVMDIIMHPRDLGSLFIAYEGGVITCDIARHDVRSAFELVFSPGAPGGSGYDSPDILTYRRPAVTTVAVHPTGHILAVGHIDGTIAFWAVEDEDRPLLCMSLDDMDVNLVDGTKFNPNPGNGPGVLREPIFKLTWVGTSDLSEPRGGDTALVVLGGTADEAAGVHVLLLSSLRPTEPPGGSAGGAGLHPFFRSAMRQSVIPKQTYFFATSSPVQDFLLIPRENPHFGGNMDPVALLLLSEGTGGTRSLEARHFPPPNFFKTDLSPTHEAASKGESNDIEAELAATLADMKLGDEPPPYSLPSNLWNGKSGIVSLALIKVERDAHYKLTATDRPPANELPLTGGAAWSRAVKDTQLIKFQPHRIIMSRHDDLTITFQDLDAHLLINSEDVPLQHSFPMLLNELTIDVASLLVEPTLAAHIPPSEMASARIAHVELARESLDCAVALETGEVIIYQLPSVLDQKTTNYDLQSHPELISLANTVIQTSGRFCPRVLLTSRCGGVTALAVSDIGLVAIAYYDGSLYVIDIRRPSLLLRDTPPERKERRSFFSRNDNVEPIRSLSWALCGIKKDPFPRIRLIGVRDSGSACVYTVAKHNSTEAFSVTLSGDMEGTPLPFSDPDSSVVISADTGLRCKADAHTARVSSGLNNTSELEGKHCIWVIAGAKGARTMMDVTGERVGRCEWSNKVGAVSRVRVLEQTDSCALVAFTDRCQALVYSLPELHFLHRIDLPFGHPSSPLITVDTTGDYLLSVLHPGTSLVAKTIYGTLFVQRRSYYILPHIDLSAGRGEVPSPPQPVPIGPVTLLGSLMGYVGATGAVTGEQADSLLFGGPRPASIAPPSTQGKSDQTSPKDAASIGSGYKIPDVGSMGAQVGQSASALGTQIGQGASAVFGRLNNALSERGEVLDSLQESMRSLERGTQNAVNQAKVAAAKQTAKGWFSGF